MVATVKTGCSRRLEALKHEIANLTSAVDVRVKYLLKVLGIYNIYLTYDATILLIDHVYIHIMNIYYGCVQT